MMQHGKCVDSEVSAEVSWFFNDTDCDVRWTDGIYGPMHVPPGFVGLVDFAGFCLSVTTEEFTKRTGVSVEKSPEGDA